MFYGARWYDSYLNRWIQPDPLCQIGLSGSRNSLACTVSYSDPKILEQYNYINQHPNGIVETVQAPLVPQNLDRFAYAANNPLKYVDNTGHCFGFAGGVDTAVCTFFAFAGPPGWVIDGLIIIGGIVFVASVAYLATDYYAPQPASLAQGDGGSKSSAQHLAMLLGSDVAGFSGHPGLPDPSGRDRRHNVQDLRNDLSNIQRNMRSGENIEDFLYRQNWSENQIKDYISSVNDYINNTLSTDVEYYGVSQELADDLINLVTSLGMQ